MGWFEVDKGGLKQLLEGRDKSFILRELVQNCFDEEGVTKCSVFLEPIGGKPLASLIVVDDAPEGFYDLSHAYTMFKRTRKRTDASKRGSNVLGEKQVLALCKKARITTTTGSVVFDEDGERHVARGKVEAGSIFEAEVYMTRAEVKDALKAARLFYPPSSITYSVNGDVLDSAIPLRVVEATLTTEYEDEEGRYRTSKRKTTIEVIRVPEGEKAMIFEMGLPIIETGDLYHYNIGQRVPMSVDRDNVSPAFLRDVRAEVLNHMSDEVEADEVSAPWVRDAMSDERIHPEVVKQVIKTRYGDKVLVGCPGDSKSREEAISHGYHIVSGSEMSSEEWDAVRGAGAIASTREMFPVEIVSGQVLSEEKITDAMQRVEKFTKMIAHKTLGMNVKVGFLLSPGATTLADYDSTTHRLRYNVTLLGESWFEGDVGGILRLIVHELGHEGGGHLEHGYHECLCQIAAKLAFMSPKELDV